MGQKIKNFYRVKSGGRARGARAATAGGRAGGTGDAQRRDSGGAGEPAGLTTMSNAMDRYVRYRNDTFKDRREDELPFIRGQAPAAEGGVVVNSKAPQTPSIKTVFTLASEGMHIQRDGTQVRCFWWTCVQKGCKLDGHPFKEISKGTGQLFRHLRTCNNALWLQLQLSSKHSKTQINEEGRLVQVSLDPVTVVLRSYMLSHLACHLCHSSGHSRKVCRRMCVLWSTASSLGRFSTSRARQENTHSECT